LQICLHFMVGYVVGYPSMVLGMDVEWSFFFSMCLFDIMVNM
jgi:hypothetical protein